MLVQDGVKDPNGIHIAFRMGEKTPMELTLQWQTIEIASSRELRFGDKRLKVKLH